MAVAATVVCVVGGRGVGWLAVKAVAVMVAVMVTATTVGAAVMETGNPVVADWVKAAETVRATGVAVGSGDR